MKRFVVITLVALFQFAAITTHAQYTKLLDFGSTDGGLHPFSALITDGTFLYGTTSDGGPEDFGTIYRVKTDGTGFTVLHTFDGINGQTPYGALNLVGTSLIGMTFGGGSEGHGVIFAISTAGTGFTKLHDFAYLTDGAFPYGSMVFDGTFLYGMTSQGGASFYGTVFKIKSDGTGFTTLVNFDHANNGASPYGSLSYVAGVLYGMTNSGGANDRGTIFKVGADGTGFAKFLDFDGTNNGSNPYGTLITDGTFLYGTTLTGGTNNQGTIFKLLLNGTGFTKMLDLISTVTGSNPRGSLLSSGGYLYGTTTQGGASSNGTVFKILTDGTGFVKLLDIDAYTSGPAPEGRLILLGSTLYCARSGGGAAHLGNIFKVNSDGTGFGQVFSFERTGNPPSGSPVSDGTFLYGMTSTGGSSNNGTVYKIKNDGTGFVKLFDFNSPTTGGTPQGSLISDGTFLYGMTGQGGDNNYGTIFKIKTDGTGFVKLLDFDLLVNGAYPEGSLLSDGTFLYGMTSHAGPSSYGNVFKIKPDGTGFVQVLLLDDLNSGAYPKGSLTSDGTFLYGLTYQGGATGFGVAFKIKPDGSGFLKLHDFDYPTGANPFGTFTLDGGTLYGLTSNGGANGDGTLFKLKPDGTGFATIRDFSGDDGAAPNGSLLSTGGFFYGTTFTGGLLDNGILFKIKPDGTGFAKLLDFNDGANPTSDVISDGSFLYGTAGNGGLYNLGILYKRSLATFTTISTFIPAVGLEGTLVTIQGTDFDPVAANNVVKFNNTTAVVVSATSETLTAWLPVGATTGPISVTTGAGTATSSDQFEVTDDALMDNVTVKSCNATFYGPPGGYDDVVETFVPANPSDKMKLSFSTFDVGDQLRIYDGPTIASPLVATLDGDDIPDDIVATGPGGELTVVYSWFDSGSEWEATVTCQPATAGSAPVIAPTVGSAFIEGIVTINLTDQISDPDNNLDLSTLYIAEQPSSGAPATLDGLNLRINYAGIPFAATDHVIIGVCDLTSLCTTQDIEIEFAGDITVYNAVSANGDTKNDFLLLEYIDVIPDKQQNQVRIYSRWGDEVFSITNYDNHDRVFKGTTNDGSKLPAGTYYYKISFVSGEKRTGFLELK